MIAIAIDGPAGAGKSTIARLTAKKLGYLYVDTGALYRTVGYAAKLRGIDPADEPQVAAMLPDIAVDLSFDKDGVQQTLLNGQDVSGQIRSPEMSRYASQVSAHKAVREYLLWLQRKLAQEHNVIMDGPGHWHHRAAPRRSEDLPHRHPRGPGPAAGLTSTSPKGYRWIMINC